MPRKNLILSDIYPYQVVSRSNNREFFYLSKDELWPIFIDALKEAKDRFSCCLHAFVLMSNHYHLIASTPLANLNNVTEYVNREVAKQANKKSNRINHFFGGRYKWTLIKDDIYYWNSIKYVFRNPVEAGICKRVEDYKYSSLNTQIEDNFWMFNNSHLKDVNQAREYMDWFNAEFKDEQKIGIQKALRRREFKLPRDKNNKIITLDTARFRKVGGT